MATETLEERLQRIEDIEAIRLLKHRYCAFCDDNYDADGIAALFTENAVWDAGPFGRNEGFLIEPDLITLKKSKPSFLGVRKRITTTRIS